jgi:hypothetical protein
MPQIIKRAILTGFDRTTYTASVLVLEATSAFLSNVPVAYHIDGTSAILNSFCAVLFFEETNYTDAVVIAIYNNGSSNNPTPPPGRITCVAGYKQINADVIVSGATNTYTLTSSAAGIPAGALAVLYRVYFLSPTTGAYLQIAPHGATNIDSYIVLGNITAANTNMNESGIVPLSTSGQIDIRANIGTCTVSLLTYGYVL